MSLSTGACKRVVVAMCVCRPVVALDGRARRVAGSVDGSDPPGRGAGGRVTGVGTRRSDLHGARDARGGAEAGKRNR